MRQVQECRSVCCPAQKTCIWLDHIVSSSNVLVAVNILPEKYVLSTYYVKTVLLSVVQCVR